MPRSLPYRRASGQPAYPLRGLPIRRAWLLVLFVLAVVGVVYGVAGEHAPAVFQTWVAAIFIVPILAAACMLGIALTGGIAKAGLFEDSPWPDGFRVLVSTALGLGALSLGMLLLGSLRLVEPGHGAGGVVPVGGEPWVPALLLPLAAGIGFLPTRNFLRAFNKAPLQKYIPEAREWLILLAAVPAAMLLIAATYPPGTLWNSEGHGYDVLEYHLELPREYAAANSTAPLAHNVYSYFPQNVEMLYLMEMQLSKFAMGEPAGPAAAGSYLWGIYPAQFLHVALLLMAALALGLAPVRLSAPGRMIAVLVMLSIPWTIITGSLAYNEAGMLLFGTLALTLSLRSLPADGAARPLVVGILLGLAMGCKLTAGLFFALPVAAIFLYRGLRTREARPAPMVAALRAVAIAALAALVLYAPWAVRAAVYSGGNPLFPLAAEMLPRDHWTAEQAAKFARGHSAVQNNRVVPLLDMPDRFAALARESVLNSQWSPGWASIYQWAGEKPDDAAWKHVGILWVMAPVAIVLAVLGSLRRKRTAAPSGAISLLIVLGLQVLMWTFFTHLQSRFLLPAVVPLALLMGLGSEGLEPGVGGLPVGVLRILVSAVVAVQALCCVFLLLPEVDLFGGTVARAGHAPRPQQMGKLFEREINWVAAFEDPAGTLSAAGKRPMGTVLLVGDATPLFLEGRILYNTVFDTSPFADRLRAGPASAYRWLKENHVNYVIVNWTEIDRLRGTYGFDDAITPEAIQSLIPLGAQPLGNPSREEVMTILRVAPSGHAE